MLTRRRFFASAAAGCGLLAKPLFASQARKYHVSVHGNDANDGSKSSMLRSIGAAAAKAYPGDTITVHEGLYRERVDPPRGGLSNTSRITYQAAPGERVEISGAEVVSGWSKVRDGVWKVVLPNSFFGSFNPYSDIIHGDWFIAKKRLLHTGAVYVDGDWLTEAVGLGDVLQPGSTTPLWFAQVNETKTTIWAQFKKNPADALTEINVRQTIFFSGTAGQVLHHGARLHHASGCNPLGTSDCRAKGSPRHTLEQGLDHRAQPDQPLRVRRHFAGQVWR